MILPEITLLMQLAFSGSEIIGKKSEPGYLLKVLIN
jgi:hypothetical protein